MRDIGKIYEAVIDGSKLTNEEVKVGEKHFRELASMLFGSGIAFAIHAKEANRIAIRLNEILIARKLEAL